MDFVPVTAMVRKDLRLFFSDRRSVIVSFVVPIAIASFFGSIIGGNNREPAPIAIGVVDEDGSTISKALAESAQKDKRVAVTVTSRDDAKGRVREGKLTVAVVIPARFGERSGAALFAGGAKPELELLVDPSRGAEVALVRGLLTEHAMQAVTREMFGGATGRRLVDDTLRQLESGGVPPAQAQLLRDMLTSVRRFYEQADQRSGGAGGGGFGFSLPYTMREEAVTARDLMAYNAYAHAFAGMGIQFLLFASTNLGIAMLLERQRGLWKRLRSAPISRRVLLGSKVMSGAIISLLTLLVSFGFAMAVFRVRISGSVAGFLLVAVACSIMSATFGLLVAALGKTEGSARGVAILAVLLMVMLGGAWVPTFIFPAWLQRLTVVVPVRWAVDGLDAVTWRGLGVASAVMPTLTLLAFAAVFSAIALARFRWEEI
jgi:ABC-type multidrug transport system permease subunit